MPWRIWAVAVAVTVRLAMPISCHSWVGWVCSTVTVTWVVVAVTRPVVPVWVSRWWAAAWAAAGSMIACPVCR
jgi:hypothetical protein